VTHAVTRAGRLCINLHSAWLVVVLAGCSGSSQGISPGAAEQPALRIDYGTHQPNGLAAVKYLLGPEGMWREVVSAEFKWNFYAHCASPALPLDRGSLLAAADGTRLFTAPDADCNVLWDSNADGYPDQSGTTHAFHEHNGRGAQGLQLATPFTMFWFDDNWLASYVTDAYGYPPPDGLSDAPRVRWRILEGTTDNSIISGDWQFDRLALDGIHYVSRGDSRAALGKWRAILDRSGYFHDDATQRYLYPNIDENYHLALFEILTSLLLDHRSNSESESNELLQHWVSVRSNILSNQERRGDELLGWRSSISNTASLMNTETISLSVMALGAGAVDMFEAGLPPLEWEMRGYTRTSDHVLRATGGSAHAGYMTLGPFQSYPSGSYQVQFFLRSSAPVADIAQLQVIDSTRTEPLGSRQVRATDLSSNTWSRVDLDVALINSESKLEFRTYWQGTSSLDVAAIRVRRL
jgi:hypothetical protein